MTEPGPEHRTRTPRPSRVRFRRNQRLTHAREFQAVFGSKLRKNAGPITVHARARDEDNNGKNTCRLGLSIGKRVGNAVKRGRFKRLIREAFRLAQHEIAEAPASGRHYDIVVSMRPHEPMSPDRYADMLVQSVRKIDKDLTRRESRSARKLADNRLEENRPEDKRNPQRDV